MIAALLDRLKSGTGGSSRGFTLVEMLVGVGIMGLAVGFIGAALFQTLGLSQAWSDDVLATKETRHAASWFARDALNAQTVDLADGAPPVSSVTISWTDQNDVAHTAAYAVVGDRLVRTLDGASITVARQVVSVSFSRSAQVITFSLTVTAAGGATETNDLSVYARML